MQDHYIPRVQLVEHNISVLFCFFSHESSDTSCHTLKENWWHVSTQQYHTQHCLTASYCTALSRHTRQCITAPQGITSPHSLHCFTAPHCLNTPHVHVTYNMLSLWHAYVTLSPRLLSPFPFPFPLPLPPSWHLYPSVPYSFILAHYHNGPPLFLAFPSAMRQCVGLVPLFPPVSTKQRVGSKGPTVIHLDAPPYTHTWEHSGYVWTPAGPTGWPHGWPVYT